MNKKNALLEMVYFPIYCLESAFFVNPSHLYTKGLSDSVIVPVIKEDIQFLAVILDVKYNKT